LKLSNDEKANLQYQIGKMPLKHIPIHKDPKLTYTQRPLFNNSINFGLQLNRDGMELPTGGDDVELLD